MKSSSFDFIKMPFKVPASAAALISAISLWSCSSAPTSFTPRSQYPPDPWVKGYANPDDCIGGEALAARSIPLPDYPKSALRKGRQGWVIIKLDIAEDGSAVNVQTERSVPEGVFEKHTERTLKTWKFAPPRPVSAAAGGESSLGLENCRILIRYRVGIVSIA